MNVLFAAMFAGMGVVTLFGSAMAYRRGVITVRSWGRRRTSIREDDLTGFNANLAMQTAAGIAFLAMAAFVFYSPV